MVRLFSALLCVSLSITAFAQTIFSIEGQNSDPEVSVNLDEFKYVYFKNAPENPTLEDVKSYLDRYINFKLKVQEAYRLDYHKQSKIISEIETYHKQLQDSYLEKAIGIPLAKEVHERKFNDIQVSHILIRCSNVAEPKDTLAAYKKIQKAYKQLNKKGTNFEQIAVKYSEDNSVAQNKGNLGYLSSLMIPFYAFENIMYSTPEGSYSKPFRTKLGYHIVKVNDVRPTLGTVDVAHILISSTAEVSATEKAQQKARLEGVRDSILAGHYSFEEAVLQVSDDINTKKKEGKLGAFTVGKMVPEFEQTAYNLRLPGDISQVFETRYGFHLVKLLGKQKPQPFEEVEDFYKERVGLDARYALVRDQKFDSVKVANGFTVDSLVYKKCLALMDSSLQRSLWNTPSEWPSNEVILTTQKGSFTAEDFALYVLYSQKKFRSGTVPYLFNRHWERFVKKAVMDIWFSELFSEYAFLSSEYKEGILLFELTDDIVWSKATKDTTGLQTYFNQADQSKYRFEDRYSITHYTINNALAEQQPKFIKKLKKNPMKGIQYAMKKAIELPKRTFTENVKDSEFTSAPVLREEENQLSVYVTEFLPARDKKLEEAKGFYVADYQTVLEQLWVSDLRAKYQINIRESNLNEVLQ